MAIPKVVQVTTVNGGSSVASQAITMASGNTPGNILVMVWRPTGGAGTVSDGSGNTWATTTGTNVGFAWAPVTVASGPNGSATQNVVTWHSSPNSFPRLILLELNIGVAGVTGWTQPSFNSSTSAGTTAPTSGSISDATSDLLLGVCCNNTDTTGLTTSWTSIGFSVATNDPGCFYLAPTAEANR